MCLLYKYNYYFRSMFFFFFALSYNFFFFIIASLDHNATWYEFKYKIQIMRMCHTSVTISIKKTITLLVHKKFIFEVVHTQTLPILILNKFLCKLLLLWFLFEKLWTNLMIYDSKTSLSSEDDRSCIVCSDPRRETNDYWDIKHTII